MFFHQFVLEVENQINNLNIALCRIDIAHSKLDTSVEIGKIEEAIVAKTTAANGAAKASIIRRMVSFFTQTPRQ